jgi:hypothetical protein
MESMPDTNGSVVMIVSIDTVVALAEQLAPDEQNLLI